MLSMTRFDKWRDLRALLNSLNSFEALSPGAGESGAELSFPTTPRRRSPIFFVPSHAGTRAETKLRQRQAQQAWRPRPWFASYSLIFQRGGSILRGLEGDYETKTLFPDSRAKSSPRDGSPGGRGWRQRRASP